MANLQGMHITDTHTHEMDGRRIQSSSGWSDPRVNDANSTYTWTDLLQNAVSTVGLHFLVRWIDESVSH